jgi:hypothetical protein
LLLEVWRYEAAMGYHLNYGVLPVDASYLFFSTLIHFFYCASIQHYWSARLASDYRSLSQPIPPPIHYPAIKGHLPVGQLQNINTKYLFRIARQQLL